MKAWSKKYYIIIDNFDICSRIFMHYLRYLQETMSVEQCHEMRTSFLEKIVSQLKNRLFSATRNTDGWMNEKKGGKGKFGEN